MQTKFLTRKSLLFCNGRFKNKTENQNLKMGFGAGHILDMNNRIKQNRAQRPSNREKFKGKNREGIYTRCRGFAIRDLIYTSISTP